MTAREVVDLAFVAVPLGWMLWRCLWPVFWDSSGEPWSRYR